MLYDMKTHRFPIVLTIINVVVLMSVWFHANSATTPEIASVLRAQALEIVDSQGRIRASIMVQPADPGAKTANGKTYSDTVILRLVDPNGRPEVKLGASEKGSGLALLGETDSTSVVLKAEGAESTAKLTNKSGQKKIITPEAP